MHSPSKKDKKVTCDEDRQTIVRVVWDINTCPLRDNDNNNVYDVDQMPNFINKALKHLHPNLKVENPMFAAGDVKLLHFGDYEKLKKFFTIQHCDSRSFRCKDCKTKMNPPTKTTDEVLMTLQNHLLEDAIDRGSPGIVLLISADFDFAGSLDYLRDNGFIVLLAQAENSNPNFPDHSNYTYIWKNMRLGDAPTYQRI